MLRLKQGMAKIGRCRLKEFVENGGKVQAFDPLVKELPLQQEASLQICADAYAAAEGVDGMMLVTEWEDFGRLNLKRLKEIMTGDVFFDGRNYFDPDEMRELGFNYKGMGR